MNVFCSCWLVAAIIFVVDNVDCRQIVDSEILNIIGPIRQKYKLPALGAAILTSDGMQAKAVVGVRKSGTAVNATVNDVWHLGSCGKAMTATMLAVLVEQGKLSWNSTLGSVFRNMDLPTEIAGISLLQLLSHQSGIPSEHVDWYGFSKYGSLMNQRRAAVADLASTHLLAPPGSIFSYSNWGYVVAGAMAEQVTGIGYEDLMPLHVFESLQMDTVSYGPMGTPGKVDQPWGHHPWGPPTQEDLPLITTSAGLMHLSLDDWSKFVVEHLRGPKGQGKLLKPETFGRLHTPPFNAEWALGWKIEFIAEAGGRVMSHGGSNLMNKASVLVSPSLDFGILVVCNHFNSDAAIDEVKAKLIALANPGPKRDAKEFAKIVYML